MPINANVAVMPFPLNPVALFVHGILRFLGYISETTHSRFTRVSDHHASLLRCEERVIDLRGDLYSEVLGLIGSDYHLKRVLSFASFGEIEHTTPTHTRLESVLKKLDIEKSRSALSEVSTLITTIVETRRDMWKSVTALQTFMTTLESLATTQIHSMVAYPPDQRILSFPVFKERGSGDWTENDIAGSFEVALEEGRICSLQRKHIGIAIGGPSQSGKSTLAVSLVAEMHNCIKSLRTRKSFADLDLKIGLQTFDIGTPTTRAISEGWAETDREKLVKLKQPWDMGLARKALRGFLNSRDKYNIVVSDLPGRVTDITRLLASSADVGIIVSNDWEIAKNDWFPMMKSVGVPIVSKIRSRHEDEGLSSLVSHWKPGELFSGRVTALNRTQKSWDLFIQWLALFLLFDILPTQFGGDKNHNI